MTDDSSTTARGRRVFDVGGTWELATPLEHTVLSLDVPAGCAGTSHHDGDMIVHELCSAAASFTLRIRLGLAFFAEEECPEGVARQTVQTELFGCPFSWTRWTCACRLGQELSFGMETDEQQELFVHLSIRAEVGSIEAVEEVAETMQLRGYSPSPTESKVSRDTLKKTLEGIAAGRVAPEKLSLTYDGLDGRFGGLALMIGGTKVIQKARGCKVFAPRESVDPAALRAMAQLLVEERVWREKKNPSGRFTSGASLHVAVGDASVSVWEGAIVARLCDAMTEAAWDKSGKHHRNWPPVIYTCFRCGVKHEVAEDPTSLVEGVQMAFEKLIEFSAEVDPGQFCKRCKTTSLFGLFGSSARDLRELDFRGYPSVMVVVTHAGLRKPERIAIGGEGEARVLVRVLNGDWDHYYLDRSEEGLPGGTPKLRDWYRALRKRIDGKKVSFQQPTVEPRLLDFGRLDFDQPVRRVLRLINPEVVTVRFSIHGVLGVPDAKGVGLPELPYKLPYRYDFDPAEAQKDWSFGRFTVQPESELALPLVTLISQDTIGANNELQISLSYPPAKKIFSRFTVRIVHQGPAGWQEE